MINLNPLYLEIQNNEVLRTIAANLSGSIGGSIGGSIEQELLTERQTQIRTYALTCKFLQKGRD